MTLSQRAVEAAARAIAEARSRITGGTANPIPSDFIHAEAAIEAALAVDGLCLVPKEPTEAMIEAGDDLIPISRCTETYRMSGAAYPEDIYRAMIGAASDGEDSPPAGTEG